LIENTPLFILGNPRSGTSLFRIILNAHPNIVIPPESGFVQWWYPKYKDWSIVDCTSVKIAEYITDLLSSKKIESFGIDADALENYIVKSQPQTYAALSACVYFFYGNKKEVKVWGDKNNYYIRHIALLKEIYPKAKFVHLVRDGRDVACSYKELSENLEKDALYRPKLSSEIKTIAEEWQTNNKKIANQIKDHEHITIRYEDVVLNFDETIKSVLAFLKLPWSSLVSHYYELNDESAITLKWKEKTLKPLDKNVVGRFIKDLTNEEITAFDEIASDCLRKFRYLV